MSSTEGNGSGNGAAPMQYLYVRDEILQVMYWMLGEGLGDHPTAAEIQVFLGIEAEAIVDALGRMVAEGYVEAVDGGGYRLTELGLREGKRSFSDEFKELTHQAHGECSPDCEFCHGPAGDPSQCPSKRGIAHAVIGG